MKKVIIELVLQEGIESTQIIESRVEIEGREGFLLFGRVSQGVPFDEALEKDLVIREYRLEILEKTK